MRGSRSGECSASALSLREEVSLAFTSLVCTHNPLAQECRWTADLACQRERARASLFISIALTVVTMALLALAVFFVRRRWRWLGDAAVTGGGLQHSRRVAWEPPYPSSSSAAAAGQEQASRGTSVRDPPPFSARGMRTWPQLPRDQSSNASTSTPWLYVHPSSPSPRGRVRLRTIESVEEFEAYMAASMQQQSSTSISEEGSSPSPGRRAAPPGMARASTIE